MQPDLCSSEVCLPSCLPGWTRGCFPGFLAPEPSSRGSPPTHAHGSLSTRCSRRSWNTGPGWVYSSDSTTKLCSRGELFTRNCASQRELHMRNYSSASGKRCAKGKGWVFEHCDQSLLVASAACGPRTGFCSRRHNERVNQSSAPTSSCQQTTLLLS